MVKKILLIFIIVIITACNRGEQETIIISVAASLTEGIEEIARGYTDETGVEVSINIGGSGTLKKQVSEGAPIDFMFLASKDDVDELVEKEILSESKNLLENTLVVVGENKIENLEEIKGLLAMGDPDFVPAGRYGREALTKSGIWKKLEGSILLTKDVRSALSYVDRAEVDYSIVYKTDALLLRGMESYEIEGKLHSPVVYSAGIKRGSNHGKKFSNYLLENIDVFEKYGLR